jgi:hypothetical protein
MTLSVFSVTVVVESSLAPAAVALAIALSS